VKNRQVIFLSFYEKNYSRSAVLLNSDSKLFERIYYRMSSSALGIFIEFRQILKAHEGEIAAIVVMSPSHKIVPVIRFYCRHLLILDAGWPLIDGNVSRRDAKFHWRPRTFTVFLKLALIDYLSFSLADIVLLESREQRERVNRKFFIRNSKMKVSLTGFNEAGLGINRNNSIIAPDEDPESSSSRIKILFRGKINNESGFEHIVNAFKLLDDRFEITYVVNQIPKNHNFHPNEKFITHFESQDLIPIYQKADICIGQISLHQRLELTIPHKAFEAAFFCKTYVSVENSAIRSFASEAEVVFIKEVSPESLSKAIVAIAADRDKLIEFGSNFNKKYLELASQEILGAQFDGWVEEYAKTKSQLP